jgi:hypothetical protein
MRIRKGLCYFVASIIMFGSCDSTEHELEINIANPVNVEENAMVNCIIENILNEVEYNVLSIENGFTTKQDSLPQVKVVYNDNSDQASSVIIDYGSENRADYLGRLKRGKISTKLDGIISDKNCCLAIEFQHFYINNLNVSGHIELNGSGLSSNQNLQFEVIFNDLIFTDEKGNSYSLEGTKTREWIEGFETVDNPWDDQFLIGGITTGVNSEGREYKSEILTPLLISHACEFIPAGEVLFSLKNEECTYNYGSNLCDNKGFYIKEDEKIDFEYGRYQFRYQSK